MTFSTEEAAKSMIGPKQAPTLLQSNELGGKSRPLIIPSNMNTSQFQILCGLDETGLFGETFSQGSIFWIQYPIQVENIWPEHQSCKCYI